MLQVISGLIAKILGSVLIAGFRKWLNTLASQRLGASQQKITEYEHQHKERKDAEVIKDRVSTDSDYRDGVRNRYDKRSSNNDDTDT